MSHDQNQAIDVALLYEAGLGRPYDTPGLNYWIHEADFVPLPEISYSLLVSNEFTAKFGPAYQISTDAFVGDLYSNVLGRPPEASGFNYWISVLESGQASREDVLISFSQSQENVAQSPYVFSLHQVAPGYWDV
ncbi:DUF4214 domain-containing protein [Alsobacter sp. SYSU BS001988]|jgi:hypothetical protein